MIGCFFLSDGGGFKISVCDMDFDLLGEDT